MRRNSEEQADREYQQRIAAEYEERIDAARAGLCGFASAEAGGAVYERDLEETRRENEIEAAVQFDHSDNPVLAAAKAWARKQAIRFAANEERSSAHDTWEEVA
jgi:hypothetical protein